MKLRIAFFVLCLTSLFANGQQTKIGSINTELIVGLMPETQKVIKLLNDYTKRLDSSYQIKLKEYQTAVAEFQNLKPTSTEQFKKVKLEEAQKLEAELQNSQNTGNKLVQLKRDELMRPLYKKLSEVIAEVAKAEGYTQVLTTNNEFAYLDERYDLTQKVMDKMGIKLPEENKKK